MDERILEQYQSIRQNWGQESADRYLSRYRQSNDLQPMREKRPTNTVWQHKRFTPLEAATIAMLKDSGESCRGLGQQWACSQGTISAVSRRRGAYKQRNDSVFDY
jgi:hypothetical protein